jgi:hypothetical protein
VQSSADSGRHLWRVYLGGVFAGPYLLTRGLTEKAGTAHRRYHAGMAGKLLAGVVIAVAAGAVASATSAQVPILRSAVVVHRHVVVQVSVGDLQPVELAVATQRAVSANGAFLPRNVRLRESIRLPAAVSGVVRWTSHDRLGPGTYFVQVMAVETGGLTDCPKFLRNCHEHWSNVRRVVPAAK